MRQLYVDYANGSEFLADYLRDPEAGGLFVRTTDRFEVGEPVELTISLPEIRDGVAIHGTVIWRRAPVRWRSALLPGIGVGFSPQSRNRSEFLLDFCNGELSALRKTGRRVPADFRVDIATGKGKISGWAKDISRGGVFVYTDQDLPREAEIDLELHLPESDEPETIPGRVAWLRGSGPGSGIGVQFLFRTPIKRARISTLVKQIEGRLSIAPPPRTRVSQR
jgi:uncharacterized protein (TIGR02266 family)